MPPAKSPDLIPLGDGLNFSTPLDRVDRGTVVSSELFFVRCNYPPIDLQPADWQMRIDGRVRKPITVRLGDLQSLPTQTEEVWIECAGNGRSHFQPPADGNQWNDFAVSNARFTGVPLRTFLEQVEPEADALEVVATGGESTEFQRGLPLEVAMRPEVLLAFQMNGQDIPSQNGGPVRLVVPRWAGIASVKWPVHLELVNQPFQGYYNAQRYIFVGADERVERAIRELPVKSVIASPLAGSTVSSGLQRVFGFAWSGFGDVARVDVSADDGRTWAAARLVRGEGPFAWTRWEFDWTPSASGRACLSARATDSAGNVQPAEPVWNKFGYEMNAVLNVEVTVGD
jgi:DMSO/TMAO reductase YedYZ molybdopterin-dependent catalytic subunit